VSAEVSIRPIDLSIEIDSQLVDITVALRPDATGADLFGLVERRLKTRPQQLVVKRTGETVSFDTLLDDIDLLRGDILTGQHARASDSADQAVVLRCDDGTVIEIAVGAPVGTTVAFLDVMPCFTLGHQAPRSRISNQATAPGSTA